MTIGKKLYLGFGSVLGVMVVLFGVNLATVVREHGARAEAASALVNVETIEAIRFQMMQNRLYLENFLLSGDTRDEAKVNKGISDLDGLLARGQSLDADQSVRASLAQVADAEHNWTESFAKPLLTKRHQVDSGDTTVSDLQIFYLQKDPGGWVTKSSLYLDNASNQIRKSLGESTTSAASATLISTLVGVFGTLLTVLLGLGIAFYTARSVTEPLNSMIMVAREIADSGDLDQKIDIHRRDELGALAISFHNMVEYLKEMAGVSTAIAGGDLTVEIQPRSRRDTLANAFSQMVQGLREMVRQVRDSASQVASGSNQVASASEESAKVSVQASTAIDEVTSTMHEMSINVQNVVKNTQGQASSVAETSASIDEMVASIQHVADTSKFLLDISQRSREEVQTGIATMQRATDGLSRTNKVIQTSAGIIGVLGQRAEDIGRIVEVIDDLAEQTNLLALNAAIEAARAGEHGLGFAVVADEVRKLAEKSAQSTREIADLIQSIQKEAREAVGNMEKSTSIVEEGLAMGGELHSALGKISTVVTEVYKFAQEISAATNEQSNGSTQISKATSRLTEITQEIASAVEEQASGAQVVVRAMEKMRELVQQSTSSSTELAAASEQMAKLSRNMLDSMGSFALERRGDERGERPVRRNTFERGRATAEEYAEAVRS
jgi:methyl-accepting chemotaxis protein